jgi:hypothetical protein
VQHLARSDAPPAGRNRALGATRRGGASQPFSKARATDCVVVALTGKASNDVGVQSKKKARPKLRRAFQQIVWQLLVGVSLYAQGWPGNPRQCLISCRCNDKTAKSYAQIFNRFSRTGKRRLQATFKASSTPSKGVKNL